ncbi:MAG: FAD-dependent oxidoreductase, partial [Cephaloticoccus sp.]|nr:FAD-dependent oxidoreductase [Cephaloticoccus sp.]
YGGWPIDLHPPEGVDRPDEPPCIQHPVPWVYDIPLGCCVARDLDNLMFAGRNLSATHVAFASTRVMATCAVVGEGVGVAAATAVKLDLTPGQLQANPAALEQVQQQLLNQDAFLIGQALRDDCDLVRSALIRASSETPAGPPENIISGQNRAMQELRGVPVDRVVSGTHRWISDPAAPLPAWIELRWDAPITLRRIEMVFDSGLHRHLTLTQSDSYHQAMCWGTGQPEIVKHYEVQLEVDGVWTTVVREENQWQRRARHEFDPEIKCTALLVSVLATWGGNEARIVRIGAYGAGAVGEQDLLMAEAAVQTADLAAV